MRFNYLCYNRIITKQQS